MNENDVYASYEDEIRFLEEQVARERASRTIYVKRVVAAGSLAAAFAVLLTATLCVVFC